MQIGCRRRGSIYWKQQLQIMHGSSKSLHVFISLYFWLLRSKAMESVYSESYGRLGQFVIIIVCGEVYLRAYQKATLFGIIVRTQSYHTYILNRSEFDNVTHIDNKVAHVDLFIFHKDFVLENSLEMASQRKMFYFLKIARPGINFNIIKIMRTKT